MILSPFAFAFRSLLLLLLESIVSLLLCCLLRNSSDTFLSHSLLFSCFADLHTLIHASSLALSLWHSYSEPLGRGSLSKTGDQVCSFSPLVVSLLGPGAHVARSSCRCLVPWLSPAAAAAREHTNIHISYRTHDSKGQVREAEAAAEAKERPTPQPLPLTREPPPK